MTKQELRKIYSQKRSLLSEAEYLQLNYSLCENFFAYVDLSFVKILHTFIPIEKNREPNTWLIIDRIKKEFPHIRLCVPRVNNETGELESFYFEGLQQLEKNMWGIPEPKQGIPLEPENVDLVLVPLLAFDKNGHRVGYGKGFYDKFLITLKPEAKKIGVSLFDSMEVIDDINENDVVINYCVTPTNFLSFQY